MTRPFLLRCAGRLACLACAALLFAASAAHATDQAQMRAGLKTLLALTEKPAASSPVAVLFDPHEPASQTDAEAIAASINSGDVVPPGLKLTAQAMSVASFSWMAHPKAAFLAEGLPPDDFAAVARSADVNGALTMSTDLDCVKAHLCVLGIVTQPAVEIYYSPAAAESARVHFTPALILMSNQV